MVNLNSFVYGRVQLAALGAVRGQWDMLQSGCATGLPPYTEGIEDQGVETGNVERLWWSVEGHGVVPRQLSSKHGQGLHGVLLLQYLLWHKLTRTLTVQVCPLMGRHMTTQHHPSTPST